MKTISKFAVATLLALSAVAPALATEAEDLTITERNSFLYTADARPIAQHVQQNAAHGIDAFAQVQAPFVGINNHGAFDGY
jgi:hypothetical protein